MTLNNFRSLIRAYVPAAKIAVIDNTLLDLLINKGVDDVNVRAAAYQGDQKFDVVAETRTYLLSSVISDFVCLDEGGLYWNNGTASSPDWKKLDGYTRRSLNDQFPRWMNQDSDNPLRYVQEGNNLLIDPMPKTSLTAGFWSFYIKKANSMVSGDVYPFSGSSVEIASLLVLDDAIIDYVRWKLNPILGRDEMGIIIESDYRKSLAEKISLLKRRLDLPGNNARMRGITIG